MTVDVELLAPAGDLLCAAAAVENGADAIYFGLDHGFNARARATNISLATLPSLMEKLHERGVRGYLTLNTLVFSDELEEFEQTVTGVANAGVDAVLIQDLGIASLIRAICPELELHASTQMTMTSAECIDAVRSLGLSRVVLARELAIAEIEQIHQQTSHVPLEAFAHGALCVAYSGQCMTSESLGGRSANRGQCAQACRLPYELVCDGKDVDLGDMKYLLSPQDLAAHALLPEMLAAGVRCFKIEGRLKTPDYVANITQKYRRALDAAMAGQAELSASQQDTPRPAMEGPLTSADVQEMELSFSRGFSPGWLQGCDHKLLVPALSSAKRGVRVGQVKSVGHKSIIVKKQSAAEACLKPGDGLAFTDADASSDHVQGGRIYHVVDLDDHCVELEFGRGKLQLDQIQPGDQVWKTDDPQLSRRLRQTYGASQPQYRMPLDLVAVAKTGEPLVLKGRVFRGARLLAEVKAQSSERLQAATKHVLTSEVLRKQWSRLGGTPYWLRTLEATIEGAPMAPLSVLNELRKQLTNSARETLVASSDRQVAQQPQLPALRAAIAAIESRAADHRGGSGDSPIAPELHVLCRSLHQLQCVLGSGQRDVMVDFQDIRQYREAVALAFGHGAEIWIATPRIQKPGEMGVFRAMLKHGATGVLVRNLAAAAFFCREQARVLGDFSLNAANELTVAWLIEQGLERTTVSYDLNRDQIEALLRHCPPQWLEVVIHQHMPMFHMEHCVFCAVLSPGTNKHNCGRPCDAHEVRLRDRVGKEHRLHADIGCRNTLYNATPQSGAELAPKLLAQGVRHLRVELLDDQPRADVQKTIQLYRDLLDGKVQGSEVWEALQASNRLGVTRGTHEERRNPLAII